MSPFLVRALIKKMKQLNEEGVTILLAEQNARLAVSISHYAYVLEVGTVALSGPASVLSENERVEQLYVGEEL